MSFSLGFELERTFIPLNILARWTASLPLWVLSRIGTWWNKEYFRPPLLEAGSELSLQRRALTRKQHSRICFIVYKCLMESKHNFWTQKDGEIYLCKNVLIKVELSTEPVGAMVLYNKSILVTAADITQTNASKISKKPACDSWPLSVRVSLIRRLIIEFQQKP